jgi:hypothetical protein
MEINIFNIPVFIGNIDCKKIIFLNQKFEKTWLSKTQSSWKFSNQINIEEKTIQYILKTIADLILPKFKVDFTLSLLHIWTNKYKKNDYQEEHIHPQSHFSFVIYKKVKESNTVLISPYKELLNAFQMQNMFPEDFHVKCKSDQIIIFPSFLKHLVKKHDYSSETISGNIEIIFKLNKKI